MAKQEVKKIGEHEQYQLALETISQVAAILTAVSTVDDCMITTEICRAIAGCNVLLGNATDELEVINA